MNTQKQLKRQAIEKEMREIILEDRRVILRENLRRRRQKLGDLKKGDTVYLYEFFQNRQKDESDEGEFLYRIAEGKIIQVTRGGFFVEGVTGRGRHIREYVNKAHIINGTVKLIRQIAE